MKNMKMLRILYIWYGGFNDCFPCHDGSIEYLPKNLRWFIWNHFPWESLSENFEPKRLVHLYLRSSSLRHLWKGTKHLPSLRKLDLSFSAHLMRTPNFREIPNFEYLDLGFCCLEKVDDSLGYCGKLIRLNLEGCGRLQRFPCVNGESLEYLNLQKCYSLEKFPEIRGTSKLWKLDLSNSWRMTGTPNFIEMPNLEYLHLSNCYGLEEVGDSLGFCGKLIMLDLMN
ncbi:TMV resistance protein N-like, partial [Lycium ferocissimum]|uniref:TMV resistance protein N-like n=1 Tax=Lycium ferocissimum TaxID=112874 RepID=UPI002815CD3C